MGLKNGKSCKKVLVKLEKVVFLQCVRMKMYA